MTKQRNGMPGFIPAVVIVGMTIASFSPAGAVASISGKVNSHGNCIYVNGQPLCTGLLSPVPGCTVSVRRSSAATPAPGSYIAITDKNGNYSLDSIPIANDGDTFSIAASAGPTYSTGKRFAAFYNGQSYTISFNLEISFTNTSVTTNDSLSFTVSTDRKTYDIGDSIRVRYSIRNTTTHAITYYYNSGCEYDLLMTGTKHDTLYWLGKNRVCTTLDWLGSIPADSARSTQFPSIAVTDAMDSVMTVNARATSFSISGSAVSVTVDVSKQTSRISHESAPGKGFSPLVSSVANGSIVLFLPQSQRVSLSLYTTAGRLIRRILDRRILPAGRHEITFNSLVQAPSVYIAVTKVDGFSIAEAIHRVK